jgi:hypothetical protein
MDGEAWIDHLRELWGLSMNGYKPIDNMLAETKFLVEASSAEQRFLWEKWVDNLKIIREDEWVQKNPGYSLTIGEIKGRPIVISISWVVIKGVLVGFYEATSQLVDWVMIEKWLDEHCNPMYDKGTRRARTDASNFHNVWHYINNLERR